MRDTKHGKIFSSTDLDKAVKPGVYRTIAWLTSPPFDLVYAGHHCWKEETYTAFIAKMQAEGTLREGK